MELPDLETFLGVKAVFIKSGIAGSIVGAVVQKVADWREAIARGFAGAGCAFYLTPLPVRWLGIAQDDTSTIGAMAFCMGLGGMGLATAIILLLKDPMRIYRVWRNLPEPAAAAGSSDDRSAGAADGRGGDRP